MKAVENGGTCVGIRCRDGVVLALEKLVTSKLLKKDANKRIATVDRNIGVVCSTGILHQSFLSNNNPRSLLVFSPMVATLSPVPAMKQHHGVLCTSNLSPSPPSPTAWDHTSKPTPSIPQSDPSESLPSWVVGIPSSKYLLTHKSVQARQAAVVARCPTQRKVAHTST